MRTLQFPRIRSQLRSKSSKNGHIGDRQTFLFGYVVGYIYDGSDVVAGLDSDIRGGHHGAFGDDEGHGTAAKFLQLLADELNASVLLLAIGNEEDVQLMTASCCA